MASVTARWVNRLTGVLLLCASCAVIVAAAPPVLRAVAADRPVQRAAKLPPLTGREPPPRPRARYGADPGEHLAPVVPPVDPHRAPDDSVAEEPGDRMGMGMARRDLKVLGDPSLTGVALGEIKAGSMVMIVKEAGDAALVIHSGAESVVMGWVRRSEIATR